MDQDNEHIKELKAARERAIADRRNLAKALSGPYQRGAAGSTDEMREKFIAIQATIEAMDQALRDEYEMAEGSALPLVPPITG